MNPEPLIRRMEIDGNTLAFDCATMHRAADFSLGINASGSDDHIIHVNVSARTVADPRFPNYVAKLGKRPGVTDVLQPEITETAALDSEETRRFKRGLQALNKAGFVTWLDDFPHGQHTEDRLMELAADGHIHGVKIDRCDVNKSLGHGNGCATLMNHVETFVTLGISSVVFEGIEDKKGAHQIDTAAARSGLTEHINLRYQGWAFAKALPPCDFARMIGVCPTCPSRPCTTGRTASAFRYQAAGA